MPTDKPWFDNQTGYLLLDEYVAEMPSFRKIMEAGIVTDEELAGQTLRVATLLRELEAALPPETRALATEALCELAVLHSLQQHHARQS